MFTLLFTSQTPSKYRYGWDHQFAKVLWGGVIVGILMLGFVPHAQAVFRSDVVLTRANPQLVREAGNAVGFVLEDFTDAQGQPALRGTIDGVAYTVEFQGCDDAGRCANYQFHARWNSKQAVTLHFLNSWNAAKRLGRVYLDDRGLVHLRYDLDMVGGITHKAMARAFQVWQALVLDVDKNIKILRGE
jgi:hypothetical protein